MGLRALVVACCLAPIVAGCDDSEPGSASSDTDETTSGGIGPIDSHGNETTVGDDGGSTTTSTGGTTLQGDDETSSGTARGETSGSGDELSSTGGAEVGDTDISESDATGGDEMGSPSSCRIGILGRAGANPSADFQLWLEDAGASTVRFGEAEEHTLVADELADLDILILDRLQHDYSAGERVVLRTWVESGGGLISMAGYANTSTDRNRQNSLVAVTGLEYIPDIFLNPDEQLLAHPVTTDVDGIQFRGGWRISPIDDTPMGDIFMVRTGAPQDIFGVAQELGAGRALVYGDEWISFDSEWRTIPGVQRFWVNAVAWVRQCVLVPQ